MDGFTEHFIIEDSAEPIEGLRRNGKQGRHSREGGNPVGLGKVHFYLAGFPPSRE